MGQSDVILSEDGVIIFSTIPKAYFFNTFTIRTLRISPTAVFGTKTAIELM